MADWEVDASDLERAARALDGRAFRRTAEPHVEGAIREGGRIAQAKVREAARRHRRTGRLERSIALDVDGTGMATTARVEARSRVAHLVAGGTAPHRSVAGPGRMMPLIQLGGSPVGFATVVQHPGTQGDPFVARGLAATRRPFQGVVDDAGHDLASHLVAKIRHGR